MPLQARNSLLLGLLGGLPALFSSGCLAAPAPQASAPLHDSVTVIANEIVREAELRADLRLMRLCVHEIHEADSRSVTSLEHMPAAADPLGTELGREFVLALADRINVVESEYRAQSRSQVAELEAFAHGYGATHVLIGDYVRQGSQLLVTVRLVDAESHLILSAARGTLPGDELVARSRHRQTTAVPSTVVTSPPAPAPPTEHVLADAAAAEPLVNEELPPIEDFNTWRKRRGGGTVAPDLRPPAEETPAGGPGAGWMRALGRGE